MRLLVKVPNGVPEDFLEFLLATLGICSLFKQLGLKDHQSCFSKVFLQGEDPLFCHSPGIGIFQNLICKTVGCETAGCKAARKHSISFESPH